MIYFTNNQFPELIVEFIEIPIPTRSMYVIFTYILPYKINHYRHKYIKRCSNDIFTIRHTGWLEGKHFSGTSPHDIPETEPMGHTVPAGRVGKDSPQRRKDQGSVRDFDQHNLNTTETTCEIVTR